MFGLKKEERTKSLFEEKCKGKQISYIHQSIFGHLLWLMIDSFGLRIAENRRHTPTNRSGCRALWIDIRCHEKSDVVLLFEESIVRIWSKRENRWIPWLHALLDLLSISVSFWRDFNGDVSMINFEFGCWTRLELDVDGWIARDGGGVVAAEGKGIEVKRVNFVVRVEIYSSDVPMELNWMDLPVSRPFLRWIERLVDWWNWPSRNSRRRCSPVEVGPTKCDDLQEEPRWDFWSLKTERRTIVGTARWTTRWNGACTLRSFLRFLHFLKVVNLWWNRYRLADIGSTRIFDGSCIFNSGESEVIGSVRRRGGNRFFVRSRTGKDRCPWQLFDAEEIRMSRLQNSFRWEAMLFFTQTFFSGKLGKWCVLT